MIQLTKEEAEKRYGTQDSNQKNNFINWDAVNSLPEEMEACFTEIKFDPKNLEKHFTNVKTDSNPSWYPTTDLMYDIAAACGIQGENYKLVEPIMEEVDYNVILMIPDGPDVKPCMRKIKTGVRVTKQSSIIESDNTRRLCSPESNEFNFFTRASIAFLKEEEYTNSYAKKGKYDNRYDTPIKRKRCLLELEKFALQQAETKAFCKTVRVLAGLPTGFTTDDLKSGKLVFVKFLKSKKYLKLEMSARLQSIASGKTPELKQISGEIFGEENINSDIVNDIDDTEPPENENMRNANEMPPPPPENKKPNPFADFSKTVNNPQDTREEHIKILREYLRNDILKKTEGAISSIAQVLNNLDSHTDQDLKNLIDTCSEVIQKAKGEELF